MEKCTAMCFYACSFPGACHGIPAFAAPGFAGCPGKTPGGGSRFRFFYRPPSVSRLFPEGFSLGRYHRGRTQFFPSRFAGAPPGVPGGKGSEGKTPFLQYFPTAPFQESGYVHLGSRKNQGSPQGFSGTSLYGGTFGTCQRSRDYGNSQVLSRCGELLCLFFLRGKRAYLDQHYLSRGYFPRGFLCGIAAGTGLFPGARKRRLLGSRQLQSPGQSGAYHQKRIAGAP